MSASLDTDLVNSTEHTETALSFLKLNLFLFAISFGGFLITTLGGKSYFLLNILIILPMVIAFVTGIFGARSAIRAIKEKEDSGGKKYLGLIGNLIFPTIFVLAVFANLAGF